MANRKPSPPDELLVDQGTWEALTSGLSAHNNYVNRKGLIEMTSSKNTDAATTDTEDVTVPQQSTSVLSGIDENGKTAILITDGAVQGEAESKVSKLKAWTKSHTKHLVAVGLAGALTTAVVLARRAAQVVEEQVEEQVEGVLEDETQA